MFFFKSWRNTILALLQDTASETFASFSFMILLKKILHFSFQLSHYHLSGYFIAMTQNPNTILLYAWYISNIGCSEAFKNGLTFVALSSSTCCIETSSVAFPQQFNSLLNDLVTTNITLNLWNHAFLKRHSSTCIVKHVRRFSMQAFFFWTISSSFCPLQASPLSSCFWSFASFSGIIIGLMTRGFEYLGLE